MSSTPPSPRLNSTSISCLINHHLQSQSPVHCATGSLHSRTRVVQHPLFLLQPAQNQSNGNQSPRRPPPRPTTCSPPTASPRARAVCPPPMLWRASVGLGPSRNAWLPCRVKVALAAHHHQLHPSPMWTGQNGSRPLQYLRPRLRTTSPQLVVRRRDRLHLVPLPVHPLRLKKHHIVMLIRSNRRVMMGMLTQKKKKGNAEPRSQLVWPVWVVPGSGWLPPFLLPNPSYANLSLHPKSRTMSRSLSRNQVKVLLSITLYL